MLNQTASCDCAQIGHVIEVMSCSNAAVNQQVMTAAGNIGRIISARVQNDTQIDAEKITNLHLTTPCPFPRCQAYQ